MAYPVILFCYNRLECLKQTITALEKNFLAHQTDLIVFSDGPKGQKDVAKVATVRRYLNSLNENVFKSIKINESTSNNGLAYSIIDGVSNVLKTMNAAIILEDDLITSRNFLSYMNSALNFYKNDEQVMSISGYSFPIQKPEGYSYDIYFTKRASSWGWATWSSKWTAIDWEVLDYKEFKNNSTKKSNFNMMGSDMSWMLKRQMDGKINSWAIRWCYHQFKYDLFSVFPLVSKISNIGIGPEATHTKVNQNRYATLLDNSEVQDFKFDPDPKLLDFFIKQFVKPYRLRTRVYYKILELLKK